MPYIKQSERPALDKPIAAVVAAMDTSPGQLNYAMTRLVVLWLKKIGGVNYFKIALVMGVFITAAFEFLRRVGFPYEDKKISESGDVYQEIL